MQMTWQMTTHAPGRTRHSPILPLHITTTGQDSIERAYQADAGGHAERAIKLYDMALQAAQEGLKLSVPTVGLSAPADSVTAWRDALAAWQSNVRDR